MNEIVKIRIEPANNGFVISFHEFMIGMNPDRESGIEIMVFQDKEEFRKWLRNRVDEWTAEFSYRIQGEKQ